MAPQVIDVPVKRPFSYTAFAIAFFLATVLFAFTGWWGVAAVAAVYYGSIAVQRLRGGASSSAN